MGWGTAPSITKVALPKELTVPEKDSTKQTILLYGKAKCGKSWATCSLIENVIKEPNTTVFHVCTDNGFDETFGYYFGNRAEEVRKRMRFYDMAKLRKEPGPFFTNVASKFFEIRNQAKPFDWLIVDLASKFWGWAQDEWIMQSAPLNSPTTYMADAAKDLKRFVEFNRSQWQFSKRLDNVATFDVLEAPPCNLLYVVGELDVELYDEKQAGGEERKVDDMFDLVGCKPAGQKTLPYAFNTIVFLTGLKEKKFFVLGDRGFELDYKEKPYGRDWWTAFTASRKK